MEENKSSVTLDDQPSSKKLTEGGLKPFATELRGTNSNLSIGSLFDPAEIQLETYPQAKYVSWGWHKGDSNHQTLRGAVFTTPDPPAKVVDYFAPTIGHFSRGSVMAPLGEQVLGKSQTDSKGRTWSISARRLKGEPLTYVQVTLVTDKKTAPSPP
jgi:hypothetical protein